MFTSFMNNTKILTKIFIGFAVVVALLLVISATGGVNLKKGDDNFSDYRDASALSNQAALVQSNLLKAQLAVTDYLAQSSEEAMAEFYDRISATTKNIETLNNEVTDPDRQKAVETSMTNIAAYRDAFEKVTTLQAKRNSIFENRLNVLGPEMESKLTELMKRAYDDADVSTAYLAAKTQRSLLLMRLYANRLA
ncbi:MAG: hypothetical protein CMM61_08910, partial [Rhodospirillaceae bacterium]|nr:hypothetical protein [Rhodospirillaceae bacterium]